MTTGLKIGLGAIAGTGAIGSAVGAVYFLNQSKEVKDNVVSSKKPTNVKEQLIADGYTPFEEGAGDWQDKFNKFRDGNNTAKLKDALQEFKTSSFKVEKSQENAEGGEALKAWCKDLLSKNKTDLTGHKTLDNAKLFCSEKSASSIGR